METDIAHPSIALPAESLPASIAVSRPFGTIACVAASDILAIILSILAASTLRDLVLSSSEPPLPGTISAALILLLCSLTASGLYSGVRANPVEELRRSTMSVTLGYFALWSATFFLHDLSPSRLVYVLAYVMTVVSVPLFRSWTRSMFANRGWWGSPVAILGYGETGKFVHETLRKNPGIGLKPVAVLDDDPEKYVHTAQGLTRGPLARCLEIATSERIPYGIVCMPSLSRHELLNLIDRYGQSFSHLIVIPNLIGMTCLGICTREVGGVIGLEVTQQLLRPSSQVAKRFLDLAITIALSPFVALLVLLAAILITLEDGGPAFYSHDRVGFRGATFKAWKLRSMIKNGDEVLREYLLSHPEEEAHWRSTQKLKRDPRLTAVGRIIRKTSIDELPQLWNVLRGEMSVVGPRPVLECQVGLYGPSFELYKQVRPGITGLWQISGRNHLPFAERVRLDKYVIQNWSVWLDLYILARTAGVVLTADGAY